MIPRSRRLRCRTGLPLLWGTGVWRVSRRTLPNGLECMKGTERMKIAHPHVIEDGLKGRGWPSKERRPMLPDIPRALGNGERRQGRQAAESWFSLRFTASTEAVHCQRGEPRQTFFLTTLLLGPSGATTVNPSFLNIDTVPRCRAKPSLRVVGYASTVPPPFFLIKLIAA